MNPALIGLCVQVLAAFTSWVVLGVIGSPAFGWLLQPVLAVIASAGFGQPRWWWLIHALFAPALVLALWLALPPWVYLAAFMVAWAIFGRVDQSRVPLYLSNKLALQALSNKVPARARLLDVGAGTGTVLAWFVRRPDVLAEGIEHAWLPWLLGRLRLALQNNQARLWRGDYQRYSLAQYDVVYAFLSPAAMPRLWQKARAEMRPGSLFISNSFTVPGVEADEMIELNDWKGARLYLWRMP